MPGRTASLPPLLWQCRGRLPLHLGCRDGNGDGDGGAVGDPGCRVLPGFTPGPGIRPIAPASFTGCGIRAANRRCACRITWWAGMAVSGHLRALRSARRCPRRGGDQQPGAESMSSAVIADAIRRHCMGSIARGAASRATRGSMNAPVIGFKVACAAGLAHLDL